MEDGGTKGASSAVRLCFAGSHRLSSWAPRRVVDVFSKITSPNGVGEYNDVGSRCYVYLFS